MKTETVTYLKEHASSLQLEEAMLITQNGKPKYVVQSAEQYEQQCETIALLKLLHLSEKSAQTEGHLSLSEAFDD